MEGLAEFRRALRRANKEVDKGVGQILRRTGRSVRDTARAEAPVRSGELRASIRHSVTGKRSSIYSNLEWAPIQEYGDPNRGIPARRFMARGVQKSRRDIERDTDRLLEELTRTMAHG